MRTAVKYGSGKHAIKQDDFRRVEAHYGFEAVFCNAYSGWEKGSIENVVAVVRNIAFTPAPHGIRYSVPYDNEVVCRGALQKAYQTGELL